MKVELEPEETIGGCPMCASKAEFHSTTIGANQMVSGAPVAPTGSLFWVKCEDCGLTQPGVTDRFNALLRWNRRDG